MSYSLPSDVDARPVTVVGAGTLGRRDRRVVHRRWNGRTRPRPVGRAACRRRWKEARSDAPRCGAVEAAADLPGRSSTKPEPAAGARTSTFSPEPINRSRPPNIFFPVLQHAPRGVAQQPKRIEGTKNTGLTGPAATGMTYQLTGIAGLVPAAVRCGW
jgi:hypothetical protein